MSQQQLWKTYKQCGCAPARGIFDYMNNHYFDYYEGST